MSADRVSIVPSEVIAGAFEETQALCRSLRRGDEITPKDGPQAGLVYEVACVHEGRVTVRGACGANDSPSESFDRLPLTIEHIADELARANRERPRHEHAEYQVGWLGSAMQTAVEDLRAISSDRERADAQHGIASVLQRKIRDLETVIKVQEMSLKIEREITDALRAELVSALPTSSADEAAQ